MGLLKFQKKRRVMIAVSCTVLSLLVFNYFVFLRGASTQQNIFPQDFPDNPAATAAFEEPVLVKPADLVHFNDIPLSQELQQSKSLLVPPQTVTQAADPSSSLLAKEQGEASVAEIPSTASSSSFSSSTRKTARVKTTVPDAPGAPTKQARAPTKDESSSMESIPYGYISNDVG
jgi:hypothetical protein